MPRDSSVTRDRIVSAASRLFYGEGIRAVSVDAVAEKAGVTKRTLYYHFSSKDELIAAYLKAQDQPTLDLYARWYTETQGSASDKVRGLFASFGRATNASRWKGCGFLRTVAELANTPGHPAINVGAAHKRRFEEWLAEELKACGVSSADAIARKVVILLEGAATLTLIHKDATYVHAAGDLAAEIVAANIKKRQRERSAR